MRFLAAVSFLVVSLLTFTLAGPVIAGSYEDAKKAYDSGNYNTAYRLYKALAEEGDADAQFNLGTMYYQGEGVPQDYAEAGKWFRKGAEQGYADAQLNLGTMYAKGQGVTQSYTEAGKWFRKAAEQSYAKAQYNLGTMYAKGQGLPQDYTEAAKWYRKAAEQGIDKAQYRLGTMYARGQGVPQDYVLAHMWLHLAASRFPASEEKIRKATERILGLVASNMTPEQIAEAQKLAREWKPKVEGK